jgi:sec-independent protein translocase protein TatB
VIDINGAEFIVLLVLAVVLIGPERLPGYAAQLASLVKRAKLLLQDAKSRVDTELGDEFRDVDWSKLDPRQYDPRRIVRDALLDDAPLAAAGGRATAAGAAGAAGVATASTGAAVVPPTGPAPYDDEAT